MTTPDSAPPVRAAAADSQPALSPETMATLRARGDSALNVRLEARYRSQSVRVSESDMFAARGELQSNTSMWPIIRAGLMAPEYTLIDAFHVQKGAQFVGASMREDVNTDWMRHEPRFDLPIVLFLGRYDCNTPSTLGEEYLDSIDAPVKRLVCFENSAHFPFWEESRRFTEEMVRVDSIVTALRHSAARRSP